MALFSILWVIHSIDSGLCTLCSCKDVYLTSLREEMEVNIDCEIGDTVPISTFIPKTQWTYGNIR